MEVIGDMLCWRHRLKLYQAAFGSLMDLTGKMYVPWAKRIFAEAKLCRRCSERRKKKYGSDPYRTNFM